MEAGRGMAVQRHGKKVALYVLRRSLRRIQPCPCLGHQLQPQHRENKHLMFKPGPGNLLRSLS